MIAYSRAILFLGAMALLLASCARQGEPQGQLPNSDGFVPVSVRLSGGSLSTSDVSPLGSPYAPDGGIGTQVVEVSVRDRDGDSVLFELDGSVYRASESGSLGTINLVTSTTNVTVFLPAAGNPYTFESRGYDAGDIDGAEAGAHVIAYDLIEDQNILVTSSIEVSLVSVLGSAHLVPRFPTNYATPGAVIDLMLYVLANGYPDLAGDYLQVPSGDFGTDYDTPFNAGIVGNIANNIGIRIQVDAVCATEVVVSGAAEGLGYDIGVIAPDDFDFELAIPCFSEAAGGISLDNEAPVVTLTSYDSVTGHVTGTATDNVAIAKVVIFDGPDPLASTDPSEAIDGVALITFAPSSNVFSATITKDPLGPIEIRVYDAAGNVGIASPVVWVQPGGSGDGSFSNPFGTIFQGVTAVSGMGGGTVNLLSGTHNLGTGTLVIAAPGITLRGAEPGVFVDASAINGYGIEVNGNNTTLENFTLLGPIANIGSAYGIKAAPENPESGNILEGLLIQDVTVVGSGRTEIDLNTARNAILRNVVADGNNTAGAGIAITGSFGVLLEDVTVRGNTWGGVAIYTTSDTSDFTFNSTLDVIVTGLTYDAPSPSQPFGLFTQYYDGKAFSNFEFQDFQYAVRNPDWRNGGLCPANDNRGPYQVFYAADLNEAEFLANNFPCNTASSTIQEVGAPDWSVLGDFVVTDALVGGLNAALNAVEPGDTVRMLAGTYNLSSLVNISTDGVTIRGPYHGMDHSALLDANPSTAATINGRFQISANDVTVSGISIVVPASNTGFYFANPVSGITLSHNLISGPASVFPVPAGQTRGVLNQSMVAVTASIESNVFRYLNTGVYGDGGATYHIEQNLFVNNQAGSGNDSAVGDPAVRTIVNNTFENNAEGIGLGTAFTFANVDIAGNTFEGNTVHVGTHTPTNTITEDDMWDIVDENTFLPIVSPPVVNGAYPNWEIVTP